jgi:formylglycine-generating enzyme required for sulfatase activity
MRTRTAFLIVAALVAAFTFSLQAQPLVTIETVTVGDAGNSMDNTGYGAVTNVFAIGQYEVSLSQYATFLNSVAATDTYNLYNANMATFLNTAGISRSGSSGSYSYALIGSGSRPVSYVSWFDAARFANWMQNGATNGASTETGAYTLDGATSGTITKNAGATWWIPGEDEWYKAAYYKGGGTNAGYWLYPTQSDTAPGNIIGSATNQANYNNGVYSVTQSEEASNTQNYLTESGAFVGSESFYDTYDLGGNVFEWNDSIQGPYRGLRGGAWTVNFNYVSLGSSFSLDYVPQSEIYYLGFRLATVPEPSTYALLGLAAIGMLAALRRRKLVRSDALKNTNPAR